MIPILSILVNDFLSPSCCAPVLTLDFRFRSPPLLVQLLHTQILLPYCPPSYPHHRCKRYSTAPSPLPTHTPTLPHLAGVTPQGIIPGDSPRGVPTRGAPQGIPQGTPRGDPSRGAPRGSPGVPPQGIPTGDPPKGSPQGIPPSAPPMTRSRIAIHICALDVHV